MSDSLTVAAVQLTSTQDASANISRACEWVEKAIQAGCELVVLPENFGFFGAERHKLAHAQDVETGPFVAPLRELAKQGGVHVLLGSIPESGPDSAHVYNTSVLIDPQGETAALYRKIHLFDVTLADGFAIAESETIVAGDDWVVADVLGWRVGLTICYDLRFPEMFRRMSAAGAEIFTVPAAFTLHTGKDHWDVLLRARAIENQAFVIASGQFGDHGGGRASWGKSQLIDPWGTVVARAPEREGLSIARFERYDLKRCTEQLPCASHRRDELFSVEC